MLVRALCFLGAFGVASSSFLPVGANQARAAKSKTAPDHTKKSAAKSSSTSESSAPEKRQKAKNTQQVTHQLLVVLSDSWNTHRGELRKFSSTADKPWQQNGDPTPVSLGRNGMAWGRGLLKRPNQQRFKKEGDGRSPAGIFHLGTAFGVAPKLPQASQNYPYLSVSSQSYCVEDTASPNYNRLIELDQVESTVWRKRSPLLRKDGLFEWGIVVKQNTSPVTVGAGSCIFLHVWRGAHIGTAGCTAMPLESATELVTWLAPAADVRLVQLPRTVYDEIRQQHGFPEIPTSAVVDQESPAYRG